MTDAFTKPKMLIADDDPAIVRLIADRCEKMGFQVESATTGIQALIKATRSRPDILIIDVNIPEADGFSVCQQLNKPGKKALDVIVMTGSQSLETVGRCETLGAHFERKGPDFWNNTNSVLAKLYPDMAEKIEQLEMESVGGEVPIRSRMLVIDDDPDLHRFLCSKLRKFGVDTLYAPDVAQGFRMASRDQPSVIIYDYRITNQYMLWRLRSTPVTKNIPVFVMSEEKLDESTQQVLKREICGRPGVTRIFQRSGTDELFEALQKICGFEIKRRSLEVSHARAKVE